jgi:hypothetical protein
MEGRTRGGADKVYVGTIIPRDAPEMEGHERVIDTQPGY